MRKAGTCVAVAGAIACTAAAASPAPPAAAAPAEGEAPLRALLACREIAAEPARLACFDRTSTGLAAAAERKDVVVLDRGEVRRTRRSLFGLTLPRLGFLGGDDDQAGKADAKRESAPREDIDTLDTVLVAAADAANGYMQLTLQEGGTWRTTDPWSGSAPRPGARVTIRRGALGSYVLHVGNSRAYRAMRLR